MSLTYPLSLTTFVDKLKIDNIKARPGNQQEFSGTGSGSSLAADIAPALREFDVQSIPLEHVDAAQIMALIEGLDGIIGSFYLYDPRRRFPQSDPTGTILGAHTVKIHTLNVNNKAMSLQGLPAGYVITVGDFLCWDYGSAPTRRAYHRVLETVTADGSGITPEFEVRDFIRPGSTTLLVVTLIDPAMKCRMVKDSLSDSGTKDGETVIAFSVRQEI